MGTVRRVEVKFEVLVGQAEAVASFGRVTSCLRDVASIRVTGEYRWNSKNDIHVAERLNQSGAHVCARGLIVLIDEWTCPGDPVDRHVYMPASPKGLNIRGRATIENRTRRTRRFIAYRFYLLQSLRCGRLCVSSVRRRAGHVKGVAIKFLAVFTSPRMRRSFPYETGINFISMLITEGLFLDAGTRENAARGIVEFILLCRTGLLTVAIPGTPCIQFFPLCPEGRQSLMKKVCGIRIEWFL